MMNNKKRVILLLPGGGVRGAFQAGFVRAMEASNAYEIEAVYGTSVGALIAPFVVSKSTDALIELFATLRSAKDLLHPDNFQVSSIFKGGLGLYQELGILRPGLKALKEHGALKKSVLERCHCAAWNVTQKRTEWFTGKDYVVGMIASSAIPGIIDPVCHNDNLYCDGGIAELLPLSALLDNESTQIDESVEYVLVNTQPSHTGIRTTPTNIVEMLAGVHWDSVLYWQQRQLSELKEKLGNRLVVISPSSNPFDSCIDVNPMKIQEYMVYGLGAFLRYSESLVKIDEDIVKTYFMSLFEDALSTSPDPLFDERYQPYTEQDLSNIKSQKIPKRKEEKDMKRRVVFIRPYGDKYEEMTVKSNK